MRGNETGEEETLGNWAALSQSSLTFLRTFPPLFSTQNLTRRNPWKLAALSQWLNFQGFLLHCLSRATPFTKSPATWQRPTHSPTWHTAKPSRLFLFGGLLLLNFPLFPLPAMPGLTWQWWVSWQEVESTTWQTTTLITTQLLLLLFSPNFSSFWPISPVFTHQLLTLPSSMISPLFLDNHYLHLPLSLHYQRLYHQHCHQNALPHSHQIHGDLWLTWLINITTSSIVIIILILIVSMATLILIWLTWLMSSISSESTLHSSFGRETT